MDTLKRFIQEIHRRSLWQVLGIYVVGSWVAYQVVLDLAEGLALPEWFPGFAVALFVIGLPVVLATAFVQAGEPPPASSALENDGRAASAAYSGPAEATSSAPGAASRLFTWKNAVLGGVGAFALWGALAAGWLLLGAGPPALGSAAGAPSRASIAVLPFTSLGADPENEVFAEGVHEDLLTQLSKIAGLTVISRTSVMRYRQTEKSLREIGEELAVRTVLEGSVRQQGGRVRLNAQLIDARSDAHLWAETYDAELTDVFAVQSDMAQKIARALQVTLSSADQERISRTQVVDPEAYRLYLTGRFHWNRRTEEGLRQAIEAFREALQRDPSYARAYAGLADAYALLPYYAAGSPAGAHANARAAAERALELDPELAEAHATLGLIQRAYELEWWAGEASLRRAIELNPGYATARQWLGTTYTFLGRTADARAQLLRARQLDPLAPIMYNNLGDFYFFSDSLEASAREYRRALELDPDMPSALAGLARLHLAQGRASEAEALMEKAVDKSGRTPRTLAQLGYLHARTGRSHAAQEVLEELRRREEDGAMASAAFALIHAGLEEPEPFFARVDRALEQRDPWLLFVLSDPAVASMRRDPRWRELEGRLRPR